MCRLTLKYATLPCRRRRTASARRPSGTRWGVVKQRRASVSESRTPSRTFSASSRRSSGKRSGRISGVCVVGCSIPGNLGCRAGSIAGAPAPHRFQPASPDAAFPPVQPEGKVIPVLGGRFPGWEVTSYGARWPAGADRGSRGGIPAGRHRGCGGLSVLERAGGREQLSRFEQRLEPREDHRPAAVELVVRALAQLVVGDGQAARIPDLLDLPGDPRGALALHLVAPERDHALDEPARRVDLQVLALSQDEGAVPNEHLEARARRPVGLDAGAEVVLGS